MRKIPDFFLCGAPKCGTTALADVLDRTPGVAISRPKEPHFFMTDVPELRRFSTVDEYVTRAFGHAESGDKLGDASVWYLYSDEAIENITALNPAAKFVICVRDPCELVISLHHYLLQKGYQDVRDLRSAWDMSVPASGARNVPEGCPSALYLNYRNAALLARRVRGVRKLAGDERVCVIHHKDLRERPGKTVERVARFIGVDAGKAPKMREMNVTRGQRGQWVSKIVRNPPRSIALFRALLAKLTGLRSFGLGQILMASVGRRMRSTAMADSDGVRWLAEELEEERRALEQECGLRRREARNGEH